MRSRRGLDVFAGRTRAGLLSRSDLAEAEYLFAYQAGCPPASAISLSMPVIADQYDSMGALHPIFQMNLPEGALLERLRLSFAKAVPDFDDLKLLAIVGQSQIGRLRYVAEGEMPGEVDRYNMRRYKSLTANIEGEDLGRVIDHLDAAIAGAGTPPKGVEVDLRGRSGP